MLRSIRSLWDALLAPLLGVAHYISLLSIGCQEIDLAFSLLLALTAEFMFVIDSVLMNSGHSTSVL